MKPSDERLDTAADRLERNTVMAGVAVGVVAGLLLLLVNFWLGIVVAVLAPAAWALYVRTMVNAAPQRLVATTSARPMQAEEFPRLENLLEGLGGTSGVTVSEVRIIDSDAMNAAVTDGRNGTILLLTSGLARGLDRLQLEGALANLLARVRDGSARYCTVAMALPVGAGRAEQRIDAALGDQHAVRADLAAVDITRYPPGLSSALGRISTGPSVVTGAEASTRWLWLVDPTTDDDLPLRIAVLEHL